MEDEREAKRRRIEAARQRRRRDKTRAKRTVENASGGPESEGIGLGIDFLKHLSRVEILLHLIDIEEGDLKKIKQDYDDINVELKGFGNE